MGIASAWQQSRREPLQAGLPHDRGPSAIRLDPRRNLDPAVTQEFLPAKSERLGSTGVFRRQRVEMMFGAFGIPRTRRVPGGSQTENDPQVLQFGNRGPGRIRVQGQSPRPAFLVCGHLEHSDQAQRETSPIEIPDST